MDGTQAAIAVDTKQAYSEIDLGQLNAINQTIPLGLLIGLGYCRRRL